jgi:uncharacterized damage-inducible protein DinB
VNTREFFTQLCLSEYPKFVGVLQATPADRLDYRPHGVCRSAKELIEHLIAHEGDLVELVETGSINHRMQVPFGTMDEAMAYYHRQHAALELALAGLDDARWERVGKFIVGGNTIMEAPCHQLAFMMLLDAIHHRGQLSTYIRPMGGKVPAIYGPSADTIAAGV